MRAVVYDRYGPPEVLRLEDVERPCSSAVYNLFGDKPGLVRAMFAEGFICLARRFAELQPTADPRIDLIALGQAFRANALANPHLYDLMFGSPFPDFRPSETESRESFSTFHALVDSVRRCIDAGVMGSG